MGLDDVVIGSVEEWNGDEIEVPEGCMFAKMIDDRLVFYSGEFPKSEMNEKDVYNLAKAWSVRENGHGFEGYWLKYGWDGIDLANPRKTYFSDGRSFGF